MVRSFYLESVRTYIGMIPNLATRIQYVQLVVSSQRHGCVSDAVFLMKCTAHSSGNLKLGQGADNNLPTLS